MKLRIKVTKEILQRSMHCGTYRQVNIHEGLESNVDNCAITHALTEVFPFVSTTDIRIWFYSKAEDIQDGPSLANVWLPEEARTFIKRFDECIIDVEQRLLLPEFSFEIDVPQEVIDTINIEDINKSKTLELV